MDLQTTQNRINTGLEVSSAKDNGGIYAKYDNGTARLGPIHTHWGEFPAFECVDPVASPLSITLYTWSYNGC